MHVNRIAFFIPLKIQLSKKSYLKSMKRKMKFKTGALKGKRQPKQNEILSGKNKKTTKKRNKIQRSRENIHRNKYSSVIS